WRSCWPSTGTAVPATGSWRRGWTWTRSRAVPCRGGTSRSRCGGSCTIWSRRPHGTTGISTSCARWPTGLPAAESVARVAGQAVDAGGVDRGAVFHHAVRALMLGVQAEQVALADEIHDRHAVAAGVADPGDVHHDHRAGARVVRVLRGHRAVHRVAGQ